MVVSKFLCPRDRLTRGRSLVAWQSRVAKACTLFREEDGSEKRAQSEGPDVHLSIIAGLPSKFG